MTKTDVLTEIDKIDIEKVGTVNRADVFSDVERLSGEYGRISELLFNATVVASKAKAHLEHIEAQINTAIRKQCEVAGERVTETKLRAAVRASQGWVTHRAQVDEAEWRVERCKAVLKTLDKKERMLDILARFQIKEYGVNQRA